MTEIDLSEFRALNGAAGTTGRCSVAEFVGTLTDAEQAQFAAALESRAIQASAIHKWLLARGYSRRPETVRVHRKKECACGRA